MIYLVYKNIDINFPVNHVTEVEKIIIIVLVIKILIKQLNDLIPQVLSTL